MKNRSIEAKVGYGGAAGAIVTGFFGTLAWLAPHVHQPPAYLVALYVTVVSLVAGYLAPHTSRPKLLTPQEASALDQVLAKSQGIVKFEGNVDPGVVAAIKAALENPPPVHPDLVDAFKTAPPAQPPAGTGP